MRSRHAAAAATIAIGIVAAGCGSGGGSPLSVPTAEPATSQATLRPVAATNAVASPPTPTTWSLADARAQFRAYLAPREGLLTRIADLLATRSSDVAAWNSACASIADSDDELQAKLISGHWPGRVATAIGPLLTALDNEDMSWQVCAHGTAADAISWLMRVRNGDLGMAFATPQANGVRAVLGLAKFNPFGA